MTFKLCIAIANMHSPYVNMYVNESCPYWYSKDLIEEMNYKNHLYRKAKATRSELDWAAFQAQKNTTND